MAVYLDYNASAPLRPEARRAMLAALDHTGNASSLHGPGRAARHIVETARMQVAVLVGARPDQIVFTSGGTEANATALNRARQQVRSGQDDALLIGPYEHPSVGEFGPDNHGGKRQAAWRQVLAGALDQEQEATQTPEMPSPPASGPPDFIASVQMANNETGQIMPLRALTAWVKQHGGLMHTDAVQATGKMTLDFAASGVDLMSLSAHKIGGPQGVGALLIADDALLPELMPLMQGGGQEKRRRPGTENIAGIAGFGAAADACLQRQQEEISHCRALQRQLETGLKQVSPDCVIIDEDRPRLPNTTCFAHPDLSATSLLIQFDLAGIAVSAGSACSSGKTGPSPGLTARGLPPEIVAGAIRVSTGWASSEQDIEHLLAVWQQIIQRHSQRSAA